MHSILRRTALLAALLLAPLAAAQAQAPAPAAAPASASKLDAMIAAGVLRVGLTGDYKPFSFRDPQTGKLAPNFIVVANVEASDGGAALAPELTPE